MGKKSTETVDIAVLWIYDQLFMPWKLDFYWMHVTGNPYCVFVYYYVSKQLAAINADFIHSINEID